MNTLIVELVVTEECNLGCKYCYMSNKNTYMTKETLHDFKDNIHKMMEQYGCSKYHISYFGGEPLLNWELVKYAIPFFNEDSRLESQVLITNGVLLTNNDILDFIYSNNCGISMSFDGIWNDINRPFRNGHPSLSHYIDNKETYNKFGGCKVMIGPDSISTLTDNFKFFVDEFGYNIPDFTLVRDDIWSWDDVDVYRDSIKKLADEVIHRIGSGKIQSVGIFTLWLMDILMGYKRGKRPMGCFAGCSGVGFLPDGVFYPCARYGDDKKFPLFDTKSGVLYQDNIKYLKQGKFSNPIEYTDCEGCSIRMFCNGGCNRSFAKKGNYEKAKPIPQLCEMFKINVSETMRIHDKLKDNKTYKEYIRIITNNIKPHLRK